MTKFQMIALDMDGTLLDEHSEISAQNMQALHECLAAGKIVCLSTGRGIFSVRPFVEQIQAELPIVTANGSEVWEQQDRLHHRVTMDADHIMELRQWALDHDIWYWATSSDRVYNRDEWCSDPQQIDWLKFGFYTDDLQLLSELRDRAEATGRYEITNSHPANLEFNPKGVNKAYGLQYVCQLYGLTMDQVVAVGDSLNDVAMIRAAGLGVAMGNAQDAVKQQADMVTSANTQDGVAQVIRSIMLDEG